MPIALQLECAAILDQDLPMDVPVERGHTCSQSEGFRQADETSQGGLSILLNAKEDLQLIEPCSNTQCACQPER